MVRTLPAIVSHLHTADALPPLQDPLSTGVKMCEVHSRDGQRVLLSGVRKKHLLIVIIQLYIALGLFREMPRRQFSSSCHLCSSKVSQPQHPSQGMMYFLVWLQFTKCT